MDLLCREQPSITMSWIMDEMIAGVFVDPTEFPL